MATTLHLSIDLPELERVLNGVDPTALLVPARVLRRVIKQDRGIGGIGLLVPHRKSYVIAQGPLLQIADRQELGVAPDQPLPAKLILMVRPEPDRLSRYKVDHALVKYWRMLFHARLDYLMQEKLAEGTLDTESVRPRIQRLGATEFDEISLVMQQEGFLLPPETPATIWAEFVAVYWTLRRFTNHLLPHFFPCLRDLAAVDALLGEEVDVDAVFAATRLPGAPDPEALPPRITETDGIANLPPEAMPLEPARPVGDQTVRRLVAKAQVMDKKGNHVRAAILRARAAEGANLTLAGARGELGRLCQRLQAAVELSDADAEKWRKALLPLLGRAARGWWSQEARFLYDLQKACVDSEQGIFAIDLVEWGLSLGQRPIRRPLPGHQAVAIVRHLRQALSRMRYMRLASGDRQALTALLENAVEHRERLMRERFRPVLADAMEEAGLKPGNVPEEIGRNKLIEELLDRVVDYGHLNIGNLRDALSRNQCKLHDLQGPVELVLGDPLIRLNRKLALVLDGVYRRGEIYMRLLHRLSSVAFGTMIGRLLMLFLILPFGLGFVVMVTPGLLIEEGERAAIFVGVMDKPPVEHKSKIHDPAQAPAEHPPDLDHPPEDESGLPGDGVGNGTSPGTDKPPEAEPSGKHSSGHGRHAFPMPNLWGVALFGLFFLLLFHVGSFRSRFFLGVGRVGRGLQTVFIHGPAWVLQLPLLQAIMHNRFWLFFRRCVLWPTASGVTGVLTAWLLELEPVETAMLSASWFLVTLAVLNTRLGRDLEETTTDMLLRLWVWLTVDFVPGLLRAIMDLSRWGLEGVEQLLYTVNEWLRFRGGEGRLVVLLKAIATFFWFWVTYVLRFIINLLVEPQINPIKHFPVVTVSHKVCLPTVTPPLFNVLVTQFDIARPRASAMAFGIVTCIPGIFGFAAWELKENWKLYGSNRARDLGPVLIGSHGETMLRLLKPGFHSGTLPKLFRKLRRAERHGQQRTARNILASLHHVEEAIGHFVERELLVLLRQSAGWHGLAINLGAIHLATNRISVELQCPALGSEPLVLGIDHQTGWLLGGVLQQGWLSKLTMEQKQTLAAALAGVYKMAGVHLTREQIVRDLAPIPVAFGISEDGLVVWPGPDYTREAVYDLHAESELVPRPTNGVLPPGLRSLDPSRVLFTTVPVSWQDWVRTWDRDRGLVNGDRRELAYAVLP